jgi:hypothetical protein
VVFPVIAFTANELLDVSSTLQRAVGHDFGFPSAFSALYASEAQRLLYPLLLASMVAFVMAEGGKRSRWVHAGLVLGTALSGLFALVYLPALPFALFGILLLGLGLLGFTPLLAFGSYGFALWRYLKGRPPKEDPQDRVNRLGPWA